MPVSRTRTNRGKLRKLSHADKNKKEKAYLKKFEEYEKMELPELIKLRDAKTIGGVYLAALHRAIELKELPKKKTA